MIKKILFIFIIAVSSNLNAQFSLTVNSNPVSDNDVIVVSELGSGTSAVQEFVFTNLNQSNSINTYVTVESITNSNGNHLTLCYDLCYYGITQNTAYPDTGFVTIPVNGTSATRGNYFVNTGLGDNPDAPILYNLKFYEVDNNGVEIGTPIHIVYKYDPTLGTNTYNQEGFSVYPTVTSDFITLKLNNSAAVNLYNLYGQKVMNISADIGENKVDLSSLSPQTYIIEVITPNSKRITKKIILTNN